MTLGDYFEAWVNKYTFNFYLTIIFLKN